MKAAVFRGVGLPINIEDVKEPVVRQNEVMVKIKACGICHTDVAMRKGQYNPRKMPIIFGHEISGIVEKTGQGVSTFKPGDRVVIYQCIFCGDCVFCKSGRENLCNSLQTLGIDRDGGYCEYICVPESNVINLPSEISFQEGAIVADSLSTPYHALKRSGLKKDQTIAIFGIGALGLNAVQLATKIYGTKVIAIDIDPSKEKIAREFGAEYFLCSKDIDPVEAVRDITKEGVDISFEFVGKQETYKQAIYATKKGGCVVLVGAHRKGVEVDPYVLFKQEMIITGSYTCLRNELEELVNLVQKGVVNVKPLVSGTLKLEEIEKSFSLLTTENNNILRLIVEPN